MSAERSGCRVESPCVISTYDVSSEPDTRREVSQLHRCDCNGSEEAGTLNVWVAAPHEQESVSFRDKGMVTVTALRNN